MAFGFFDPGSTPEQLKRRREELDFMASRMGRAQNVGQGVGDLITGLAGGFMRRKANVAENSGIEAANSKWSAFNPFGNPSQPPQAPQMSGGEPFPNPALIEAGNEKAPPVRDFGGMNGIPPTKSIPATALLQKPAPVNPSQEVGGLGGLSVRAAGKGWTEVIGPDGKPVRREGARNWRNHNPGNIEYGDFAKNNGAIGTDGRFAVFPTYEAGRKAKENLLFNSGGYRGKTIAGAISRYAPQFENDTGGYISQVAQAIGVSPNTPLASLNPQQRTAMLDAMQRVEGFKVGRETIGGKPVQVASNDPQFIPASAPPQDVSQETMATAQPVPEPVQQVAQNGDDERLKELWDLANNKFLPDDKKAMAQAMLEKELQKRDPAYQMQLQAAQQGLTKNQLEIDAMRNPQVSPMDQVRLEQERIKLHQMQNPAPPDPFALGEGARVYDPATRQIIVDATPKQTPKPAGIQEYEYAKEQGFKGTYQDWEASKKGGMSLQTNADGTVTFQQGNNIKPLTESQSKDTVYSVRAKGALKTLDPIANNLASYQDAIGGAVPVVGNSLKSTGFQLADQAGNEFLQAVLRKDTGAAITKDEQSLYGDTYLPRPGDSPQVMAQKAASRQRAILAIEAGMTPAAIVQQELALRKAQEQGAQGGGNILPPAATPAPPNQGGLPPGAVQELMADPSPESQAMFDEIFGPGAAKRALGGR